MFCQGHSEFMTIERSNMVDPMARTFFLKTGKQLIYPIKNVHIEFVQQSKSSKCYRTHTCSSISSWKNNWYA